MSIQRLEIQILMDDVTGPRGILAEHGFSALAKTFSPDSSCKQILFDTGPSSLPLQNNVKRLNIDLAAIDAIVLSHGHWDHVGGLMDAVALSKKRIPVICHPQALSPKMIQEKEKIIDVGFQELFTIEDLEKKAKIVSTKESHKFSESIMTTGEISRNNDYETLTGNLLRVSTVKDGQKVPDELEDDLSLIFRLADDSIIILAGCCHSGIVNTTEFASELTGSTEITGIVGGLHLHDASEERLTKTVRELKKYPISKIAPSHCSGLRGKLALFNPFFEQFVDAKISTTIIFESRKENA